MKEYVKIVETCDKDKYKIKYQRQLNEIKNSKYYKRIPKIKNIKIIYLVPDNNKDIDNENIIVITLSKLIKILIN